MPKKSTPVLLGQRMTSQRRLLFDIISTAGGHLDADEIFRRAKEGDPLISLSTVYRNLRLFKERGLVMERHFIEEHHHYEVKDSAEHYHLVCRGCGAVFEFESPLTEKLTRLVEKESGFHVSDIEVNMQGYCPNCREMRKE